MRAEWSGERRRWALDVEVAGGGGTSRCTAGFLVMCTGCFRHDRGYSPELPGVERFAGPVAHPRAWPDGLDWTGRRVVVVGSGATTVTLVPAPADRAAHVTVVQRSPGYVLALPTEDAVASALLRGLPERVAHPLIRWKNRGRPAGRPARHRGISGDDAGRRAEPRIHDRLHKRVVDA
ncbi:hypothetical protein ACFP3R_27300 [Saccharothrix lopnurensis]|uniref:Uncharacterized protein n=1 Tax=Saccharothrix lopnurensis TaxID=1670621 RepID=A0ABW1PBJ1_9PSEU